jgi:hypothetical protein
MIRSLLSLALNDLDTMVLPTGIKARQGTLLVALIRGHAVLFDQATVRVQGMQ